MGKKKRLSDDVVVTFAQYVGRKIKLRREQLGLTQDHVSKACNISKSYLSECENGKRSIGFHKIHILSRVLGRSTDWFIKGWD